MPFNILVTLDKISSNPFFPCTQVFVGQLPNDHPPTHYETFILFLFFLHFFWPTVSLICLWHTLSWAACHLTSGCQHLYSALSTWCYKILHKPIDGNIFIKHLHILLLVKFILNYIITFSTTNGIDFAYLRP